MVGELLRAVECVEWIGITVQAFVWRCNQSQFYRMPYSRYSSRDCQYTFVSSIPYRCHGAQWSVNWTIRKGEIVQRKSRSKCHMIKLSRGVIRSPDLVVSQQCWALVFSCFKYCWPYDVSVAVVSLPVVLSSLRKELLIKYVWDFEISASDFF